jgi:hypothetical protein
LPKGLPKGLPKFTAPLISGRSNGRHLPPPFATGGGRVGLPRAATFELILLSTMEIKLILNGLLFLYALLLTAESAFLYGFNTYKFSRIPLFLTNLFYTDYVFRTRFYLLQNPRFCTDSALTNFHGFRDFHGIRGNLFFKYKGYLAAYTTAHAWSLIFVRLVA